MAAEPQQKPIHALILDTGPLIKNAVSISTIINSAEEIFTTSAILSEIRDEATRSRVQTTLMPFLKIKNPSPASYDAVIAFSKKTGDHAVLSRQDLGILALAYEVHCERNGGPWGLREAPKQPPKMKSGEEKKSNRTEQESSEDPVASEGNALDHQAEQPKEIEAGSSEQVQDSTEDQKVTSEQTPAEAPVAPQDIRVEGSEVVEQNKDFQEHSQRSSELPQQTPTTDPQSTAHVKETEEDAIPAPTEHNSGETSTISKDVSQSMSNLNISNSTLPSPPVTDDSDSDGEWITPSNLTARQAKDSGLETNARTSAQKQMDVATMTIDFAMQNVLLQMNLNLLSTNMQRIKHLTSKVLRCHACFNIVKQMDKQFCPRCGGASLRRVSCSTNAKGEFKIHLAKNYQWNKRGDKFSVPKPIAGTANGKWSGQGGGQGGWGRDLILAEDQKEYQKQMETNRRSQKAHDLMDDDYLPNILTGDRGRAGGRPKVGAGKNVNSKKRG